MSTTLHGERAGAILACWQNAVWDIGDESDVRAAEALAALPHQSDVITKWIEENRPARLAAALPALSAESSVTPSAKRAKSIAALRAKVGRRLSLAVARALYWSPVSSCLNVGKALLDGEVVVVRNGHFYTGAGQDLGPTD